LNVRLEIGDWPRIYDVRRVVAGTAFGSSLRVEREDLTLKEAMDAGYVAPEDAGRLQDEALELYRVVSLSSGTEEEALVQLWSASRPVWIFERTPFRSSRFIFEE